ncbi:hypothetical protein M422DRAFT_256471 [Sphaerobolus stellatus SS14]|uniref:Uncharacterized protein n=1 Tax=Sphaerobolus stellatus (strain SS14) TaxID=990650 RepID=A0A0C9V091_SPHS4|nr:hypothetical protein M422DRAFT_256471 [Sphaerobolus stellatus SS14]
MTISTRTSQPPNEKLEMILNEIRMLDANRLILRIEAEYSKERSRRNAANADTNRDLQAKNYIPDTRWTNEVIQACETCLREEGVDPPARPINFVESSNKDTSVAISAPSAEKALPDVRTQNEIAGGTHVSVLQRGEEPSGGVENPKSKTVRIEEPSNPDAPPKRGRGRPPKAKKIDKKSEPGNDLEPGDDGVENEQGGLKEVKGKGRRKKTACREGDGKEAAGTTEMNLKAAASKSKSKGHAKAKDDGSSAKSKDDGGLVMSKDDGDSAKLNDNSGAAKLKRAQAESEDDSESPNVGKNTQKAKEVNKKIPTILAAAKERRKEAGSEQQTIPNDNDANAIDKTVLEEPENDGFDFNFVPGPFSKEQDEDLDLERKRIRLGLDTREQRASNPWNRWESVFWNDPSWRPEGCSEGDVTVEEFTDEEDEIPLTKPEKAARAARRYHRLMFSKLPKSVWTEEHRIIHERVTSQITKRYEALDTPRSTNGLSEANVAGLMEHTKSEITEKCSWLNLRGVTMIALVVTQSSDPLTSLHNAVVCGSREVWQYLDEKEAHYTALLSELEASVKVGIVKNNESQSLQDFREFHRVMGLKIDAKRSYISARLRRLWEEFSSSQTVHFTWTKFGKQLLGVQARLENWPDTIDFPGGSCYYADVARNSVDAATLLRALYGQDTKRIALRSWTQAEKELMEGKSDKELAEVTAYQNVPLIVSDRDRILLRVGQVAKFNSDRVKEKANITVIKAQTKLEQIEKEDKETISSTDIDMNVYVEGTAEPKVNKGKRKWQDGDTEDECDEQEKRMKVDDRKAELNTAGGTDGNTGAAHLVSGDAGPSKMVSTGTTRVAQGRVGSLDFHTSLEDMATVTHREIPTMTSADAHTVPPINPPTGYTSSNAGRNISQTSNRVTVSNLHPETGPRASNGHTSMNTTVEQTCIGPVISIPSTVAGPRATAGYMNSNTVVNAPQTHNGRVVPTPPPVSGPRASVGYITESNQTYSRRHLSTPSPSITNQMSGYVSGSQMSGSRPLSSVGGRTTPVWTRNPHGVGYGQAQGSLGATGDVSNRGGGNWMGQAYGSSHGGMGSGMNFGMNVPASQSFINQSAIHQVNHQPSLDMSYGMDHGGMNQATMNYNYGGMNQRPMYLSNGGMNHAVNFQGGTGGGNHHLDGKMNYHEERQVNYSHGNNTNGFRYTGVPSGGGEVYPNGGRTEQYGGSAPITWDGYAQSTVAGPSTVQDSLPTIPELNESYLRDSGRPQ